MWLPDLLDGYSVRGAYDLLTTQNTPIAYSTVELIWHHRVPLEVSVFAWRLICDRLLTKSNLVARGVLSYDVSACVSGCGHPETAER